MFAMRQMASAGCQVPEQASSVPGCPRHPHYAERSSLLSRLCSSCYVNHYNHASQDAKKKYDRSRKRALSDRRSVRVSLSCCCADGTELSSRLKRRVRFSRGKKSPRMTRPPNTESTRLELHIWRFADARCRVPIAPQYHPSAMMVQPPALPPSFSLPVVPQPLPARNQAGFRPPLSPVRIV
jgi:hypothetical protein